MSFQPLPSLDKEGGPAGPGDLIAEQLVIALFKRFPYTTVVGDCMLPQNKKLKPFARKLRNNATRHENKLWYEFLRGYPVQFNRRMGHHESS